MVMDKFTFSKRLYSIQGMALFLIFTLTTVVTLITRRVAWQPFGLIALLALVAIFTITGTLGWRYVLRKATKRDLYVYFGFQLLVIIAIFALENAASGGGATSGNLIVLLLLQSCVLSWRVRLSVLGIADLSMILISLVYLPALPVITATISLALMHGAVLLLGDLTVSEERARQELVTAHQRLSDYAAQVDELATTRERNRLAREIHDNLGHYLTIVNVQIEVAKTFMHQDPEQALVALSHAQRLTKEGLTAVRESVTLLRGTTIQPHMLHETIAQLVDEHRAAGLQVDYRVEGQVRFLSDDTEVALYRIVQEGLTNIRKHAHAQHTNILICYKSDGRISVSIRDDGVGSQELKTGFGLLGLTERVQLLGGNVTVETKPGHGFKLSAEISA
jgi:signal transduction histidine kinase